MAAGVLLLMLIGTSELQVFHSTPLMCGNGIAIRRSLSIVPYRSFIGYLPLARQFGL